MRASIERVLARRNTESSSQSAMRSLTIGDFALGNSFRLIWYSTTPPLSLSLLVSSPRVLLRYLPAADNSRLTIVFSSNLRSCKSCVAILNKIRARINAWTPFRPLLLSPPFPFYYLLLDEIYRPIVPSHGKQDYRLLSRG